MIYQDSEMGETTQKRIRELEAARNIAEQKYSLITNATIDAIIMITPQGTISFWNPAAEKIFGYKKQEVIGEDLHLIIAPLKYHHRYKEGFKVFKAAGKGPLINKMIELSAIKKDGTQFPISLSLSATKAAGEWVSIGIVRDITRRKNDEKALKNAHIILEKTVEQRTAQLKKANNELSEANVALKVLLKKSGEQNTDIEEKVLNNIDNLVLPYLEELISKLKNETNQHICKTIKKNLEHVTSSFSPDLILKYRNLSSREIQVADLIRHGKSTKEMAAFLNVSIHTIETYRGNLRKKLGLKNKKINLKSFLKSG